MEDVFGVHLGAKFVDFADAIGSGPLLFDETTLNEFFKLESVFLLGPHGVEEAD